MLRSSHNVPPVGLEPARLLTEESLFSGHSAARPIPSAQGLYFLPYESCYGTSLIVKSAASTHVNVSVRSRIILRGAPVADSTSSPDSSRNVWTTPSSNPFMVRAYSVPFVVVRNVKLTWPSSKTTRVSEPTLSAISSGKGRASGRSGRVD